ncbi:MAG: 4Fe-4S cluster-binding domain-containing protein [Candidatus Aminicenantes bacterium]|nr:4Fe-4S cluster-binding domain-containing protein [Candidatus Aminicenantes bacterium]
MLKKAKLNIASQLVKSVVNGPGTRYVIWLQGCPFKCPGCFNKKFQPFFNKNLVNIETLAKKILSVEGIEGVTYTGGEPMVQAEPLYYLSSILKKYKRTIVCYTGFTMEELEKHKDPFTRKLISLVDILIDGRFQEDKKAHLVWRGSTNQKVHFLSDVYSDFQPSVHEEHSQMELVIGEKGITYTGTVKEEIINRLNQLINRREIEK